MTNKPKKGSKEYLIDRTDLAIGDLVYDKTPLYKAYNYYHGIRDKFQYEHLEKNYGIGNPTSVEFIPFTKKHIDAIVGEYLSNEPQANIACKDDRTLTLIMRDKQLEAAKRNHEYVKNFLNNQIYAMMFQQQGLGKQPQQSQQVQDEVVARDLKQIEDQVNDFFISNYEKAGLTIIQYIMQSRNIDLKNKLWDLLRDLLIAGEAYYKVVPSPSGTNFKIEVEDPLNTFVERNPKSHYMKDGYRSVVRKWMSKQEIVIEYGDQLTEKDIDELDDYKGDYYGDNLLFVEACAARGGSADYRGLLQGVVEEPLGSRDFYDKWDLLPVYEVEWIDYQKVDGKLIGYRYEVVRIGEDIYILKGVDKNQVRSMDAPNKPRLTVNGMFYTDRTGAPYSLMLATASLQDKYDLLNFYRDNLIALSGTKGSIIDLATIPEMLGDSLEERIIRHQAMRKTGTFIIDSSQEGEQSPNTIYNGFDETINPGSIQAIQTAIESLELQVSGITGVFRERLGGIQQRDAVRNVELGMQLSYIITKQYYQVMDTLLREILLDSIDVAKKVYKDGFTGQVVLGGQLEIFKLLPEYFTITDFDIHIGSSAKIMEEKEVIKQLAIQLAGSNQIDPEILILVTTSTSLTELKHAAQKSIRDKKIENNQIQQLQQQLEQATKQVDEMQKQLQQATNKVNALNEKKLNIEQQDTQMQQQIDWYKVKNDVDLKNKELDLIKERNKLEALQLVDNNPNNDAINNSRM